jgi:hypothetical protein
VYWVPAPAAAGAAWSGAPALQPASWNDPFAGTAPAPRRGLPGWGIALIIAGVLSVLALVVATVIGLAIAASSGFGEFIEELDEEAAQSSAAIACDYAADAFIGAPSEPDPRSAAFQVRPLTIAVDEAEWATDGDAAYAPLLTALENALEAAEDIAALPVDPTEWSAEQSAAAAQSQRLLDASADRIVSECDGVTDPWLDQQDDFTF